MTTTFLIEEKQIKVSAKLLGENNKFMPEYGYNYVYNITVSNGEASVRFKYNTSINDYKNGKNYMESEDLRFALECFLSDATAGDMRFDDFCGEFGYDTDSRKAEKTYKECIKQCVRAQFIFTDMYKAYNELNEMSNA